MSKLNGFFNWIIILLYDKMFIYICYELGILLGFSDIDKILYICVFNVNSG